MKIRNLKFYFNFKFLKTIEKLEIQASRMRSLRNKAFNGSSINKWRQMVFFT